MLFVCLHLVATYCCIALPRIFMRRRLPGSCPMAAWLAQRSTLCRTFYLASSTLLETALYTINIEGNGAFPGSVQNRLGSLHDRPGAVHERLGSHHDHSFVALYTAPHCTSSSGTRDAYGYEKPVLLIFTKFSKRMEPLVIRFEIMLITVAYQRALRHLASMQI